ncbi:DenX|uniref:Two component transcriptional regulator, LytTR family n=1 Tax=Dendrosporobacter quercicolus TaxID=146817 RepID=A0A1G9P286_9FIRM|nr:LytTR family DNA-binding domain-containing protein [Dendrosporobacter quercicolus]NSL47508.1 DenX [Dendrosporobacter quercicolus DSM 1736]SDL92295.1 two component transcriptional regulator, LytTR family [Dendrosporobacter quercicolus]
MLKVIISEDDSAMRLLLTRVIERIDGVEIIGKTENGRQLIELVEQLNPEAVFLDINMPGINGVEASKEIFAFNPRIFLIFVTAYDCFTHEAFDVYAFDYIVKPFDLNRLHRTIKRIKELKEEREKIEFLKRAETLYGRKNPKLKISTNEKSVFVNVHDIILITRNERKTTIYTTDGLTIQTNDPLHLLEQRLEKYKFFRCHKGFIINSDMVLELAPWGAKTYLVKLSNTTETALMTLEHAREFQKRYCL